uniref:Armadillo repeat-containing protein 7 n=1 Tax=Nothoprocta perdicaria TaxID=30464 RepID=A0A8C6YTF6_NOTPE
MTGCRASSPPSFPASRLPSLPAGAVAAPSLRPVKRRGAEQPPCCAGAGPRRALRPGAMELGRLEYLQALVTEFQVTDSADAKEQVLANLANFAYDPQNYEHLRRLQVLDLFLDALGEDSEALVEFAMGKGAARTEAWLGHQQPQTLCRAHGGCHLCSSTRPCFYKPEENSSSLSSYPSASHSERPWKQVLAWYNSQIDPGSPS